MSTEVTYKCNPIIMTKMMLFTSAAFYQMNMTFIDILQIIGLHKVKQIKTLVAARTNKRPRTTRLS